MTAPTPVHVPVLLNESLQLLDVREGGVYIDCTTGLGGHSSAIAGRMGETGRLLCLDQDREALEFARAKLAPFGRRVSFVHANFRELADVAKREGFQAADGILMDLGISSFQIGEPRRGFAFALEGPLDMRMDPGSGGITAEEIVNTWDETSLADLFFELGEERQSRRIARAIVRNRPLRTTWELARSVEQAVGGSRGQTHIHPATKVFLALRLRVNGELDTLITALPLACSLLGSGNSHGGRLAVISFHSLEDRIVKQFFRREATDCICPPGLPVCRCGHTATLRELTRKAIRPSEAEVAANPRSRSAVLRAVERIG
ncbi:MAG: 16S rRNA (cytosine(1402)-N(4))-methyltransferase RsmH [Dehalococcoidia bacterium]|uniref:16S rRNA (cytosine(1402)-N(4))-methyltransferase RsmH n=1 Tax=Candidatus Amarobacter glycogenicus TaxID=3140699 RepID=UPI002A181E37|nr:16S rRNA (cytosine(1402)-N(4))-methyltransferase RsmH [Dehalococcoidia bacterium]MBK7127088.1 16S rRNA (cytosine(1402)-N(4))-methyltransferase RsmH [Dehalococcoidia bacterium]MBK8558390.1 16S rRNA (cytosine(1402)-N(4))-methyltransferase RsmH [Dehalococcoidia bacterium]MBK9343993.1 16S rRNA (cytosine(1402)-N(4))-methyltransferase RsmH [Dehalococcoidia bacterium]MBK9612096.1 16S rRNA (cytosine(1402)-N(4))-methyltransferase RsmH [Dehalococcoidia bacterium]